MNTRKGLLTALVMALAVVIAAATIWPLVATARQTTERDSSYSEILGLIKGGSITSLTIHGERSGVAQSKDGLAYHALLPAPIGSDLAREAVAAGTAVRFADEEFWPYGGLSTSTVIAIIGDIALFAAVGFMLLHFMGNRGGASFMTSAKPVAGEVRFGHVAGCDAEKAELIEIVDFLRCPQRYHRLGGRVPTGVLLSGPPGTGKTLLARAVAGEAGVPFFHLSGSDFVEMFVGVGASRVRQAFAKARKKAPCIIFIDEIDAVGKARSGNGTSGGNDERDQTLNQLLVEMDGFKPNSGVIVIAATNRPEILDKALTRPGRFSRHVVLGTPDIKGRLAILTTHARKLSLAPGLDLEMAARGTPGFAGAELANLVNEAAIIAARQRRPWVTAEDFEAARDRMLMGNERPAMAMDDDDRRLTAVHEAGHALVALHCPASDPIHKATILPRGQTLGMVMRLPERDHPSLRRSRLEADLTVAMGGRAAELLAFGQAELSTGASGDLSMATQLARRMVGLWGLSRGPHLAVQSATDTGAEWSEDTKRCLDAEVEGLLQAAMRRAEAIIMTHRHQLEAIAEALLEQEILTGEEIADVAAAAELHLVGQPAA